LSEEGFAVAIQEPGVDPRTLVETSNLPFYMSWSPDGQSLGVLHNGIRGIDFRIVDVGKGSSIAVDTAAPYYFSWSPSGDQVVTHAGEDRVETIRPDGDRHELVPTSPTYLAPQWTPRGTFHVVGDELVIEDDEGERAPVASVSGLAMFIANPQGTRVALQLAGGNGAIQVALEEVPRAPSGSVVVIDLETGVVDVAQQSLSLGFFWSPDGESLLVLTPDGEVVVPRVWSGPGDTTDYPGYLPPPAMLRDTFPFFPQYAQSVRFWSPDSSMFALAGDIEGEQGIWVQDLSRSQPTKVSEGTWVAWSGERP
jgi:TolB protein